MPRRLLKRLIPNQAQLRKVRGLGIVGERLFHPSLWHLSRRSVRNAVLLGVAFAFIPLPAHTLIGALCAVWLRCNVAITVALIWINNPFTIAPLYFGAYKLGAWLLGQHIDTDHVEVNLGTLHAIGTPFLLGCTVLAIVTGVLAAALLDVGWRWSVRRQWQRRRLAGDPSQPWRERSRARAQALAAGDHARVATPDAALAPDQDGPRVAPDRGQRRG